MAYVMAIERENYSNKVFPGWVARLRAVTSSFPSQVTDAVVLELALRMVEDLDPGDRQVKVIEIAFGQWQKDRPSGKSRKPTGR